MNLSVCPSYRYDREFRKTLGEKVPGSESFIKVALLEEPPFQDLTKTFNEQYGKVKATFGSVSDTVGSLSDTVSGFFGAKKGPEVQPTESKDKEPKKKESEAPPVKEVASSAKSETKTAAKSDAAAPPPSKPAKPKAAPLPRDVVELEKEIELSAQLAIKQYNAAIAVIKKCVNISLNPIYITTSRIDPYAGSMMMCAMWSTGRSSTARTTSGEHWRIALVHVTRPSI